MKRVKTIGMLGVALSVIVGCGGNSGDLFGVHDWTRDLFVVGVGYLGFNLLGEQISDLDDRINSLEDELANHSNDTIDVVQIEPKPDIEIITVVGADGENGTDGLDGINCWDLNSNGIDDEDEDTNGDGIFDALDCQGEDGLDGTSGYSGTGSVGPMGPAGADGEDGTLLFNTFVDDFFTVEGGSYAGMPLEAEDLPVVEIYEPAIGYCDNEEVGLVAFRVPIPVTYPGSNSVTMRLFIWRTGEKTDNCMVLRLDAFRSRHGFGNGTYGSSRFITLDDPIDPDPTGALLVVDLPLNNEGDDGLCFPNNLEQGDLLAFELSDVTGFSDGGCFTIIGVEMYESEETQVTIHATIAKSFEEIECSPIVDCDVVEEVPEGKAILCHVPPGNEGNAHTIMVSENAVERHLLHGDTEGPCFGDCE